MNHDCVLCVEFYLCAVIKLKYILDLIEEKSTIYNGLIMYRTDIQLNMYAIHLIFTKLFYLIHLKLGHSV